MDLSKERCPECGHTWQRRNPLLTVDMIIEIPGEPSPRIVLVKRKNPPHGWALPGGFVDYGETVEEAAASVWSIITGGAGAPYYALHPPEAYADQVRAFSAQQHFTFWTFDGDTVRLEVVGLTGEVIEDVILTPHPGEAP